MSNNKVKFNSITEVEQSLCSYQHRRKYTIWNCSNLTSRQADHWPMLGKQGTCKLRFSYLSCKLPNKRKKESWQGLENTLSLVNNRTNRLSSIFDFGHVLSKASEITLQCLNCLINQKVFCRKTQHTSNACIRIHFVRHLHCMGWDQAGDRESKISLISRSDSRTIQGGKKTAPPDLSCLEDTMHPTVEQMILKLHFIQLC